MRFWYALKRCNGCSDKQAAKMMCVFLFQKKERHALLQIIEKTDWTMKQANLNNGQTMIRNLSEGSNMLLFDLISQPMNYFETNQFNGMIKNSFMVFADISIQK